MSSKYEGFPAVAYSGLWLLKTFGKLRRQFPDLKIDIVFFVTDAPPATLIKIDKGDFEIELLENVKDVKDLDNVECDAYLALSTDDILGGINSIIDGVAEKRIKMKNPSALGILGKILSVL
ncbi:MAG: hypothetical protein HWN67_20605 [Candidatus Helarchaeota archaeon]|nr:hypothetical protein [Candidatus Helarchaeota archaeon]